MEYKSISAKLQIKVLLESMLRFCRFTRNSRQAATADTRSPRHLVLGVQSADFAGRQKLRGDAVCQSR
jgi:hypothetical protein